MSSKYPGGIISKTAPTPSGPYADSTAPGVWTLEQQAYWQKLGQWPTAGNVNPSAFIENLFSTYLYTGNGSTQTITNGIDLSGQGGMVWLKTRNVVGSNYVQDTARGATQSIYTNSTAASGTANILSSFTSSGFVDNNQFSNGDTIASWTFREQAKFFDVVTYTGNGVSGRAIPHNLGSAPGFIAVKILSSSDNWECYHRGVPFNSANVLWLNSSNALTTGGARFTSQPTSTDFYVGSDSGVNGSGQTYVAYLFAHDAGGFGLSGSENVISCGSYTGNGSNGQSVSIGYEPQWLLIKRTDTTANWQLQDNMRPFSVTATEWLNPNTSNAESTGGVAYVSPTATGFTFTSGGASVYNANGGTYIYIAIRRGPMAVPTLGTSVFSAISRSGTGATVSVTGAGFPPDAIITKVRNLNGAPAFWDKLRGPNRALTSNDTDAEETTTTEISSFDQDGFSAGTSSTFYTNASGGYTYINWQMRRAPSFFDEVCYTGTGSATTQTHNLGVVPELIICKRRNISSNWFVFSGFTVSNSYRAYLEDTSAGGIVAYDPANFFTSAPTATSLPFGSATGVNASGGSYVAYLFATCAGVSKVGSYTGTGTLTTINCGFTGGARFVLIKRTDDIGEWYVWDTIRGMIAGTDPSLRLNNGSSESNANSVYTITTGFQLLASPSADVNTNGGSYIFLAIA